MLRVEFDSKDAIRGLDRISKALGDERSWIIARKVAKEMLDKAKAAPVPEETGKLRRSAAVERTDKPGEVRFGFDLIYATVQDRGMTARKTRKGKKIGPIKKKAYGSDMGPNQYFSFTVRENAKWAVERCGDLVQEVLAKVTAKKA